MYTLEVEIPFKTKRHAEIALNSVIQDEEPRSGSSIERYYQKSHIEIIKIKLEK